MYTPHLSGQTATQRGRWACAALVAAMLLAACGADSPQDLVAKGKAELEKGEARTAVIRFKSALQLEPGATATRALLGQALVEAGDARGAIVELTKALEQRGDPNVVLPALARAMLDAGQFKRLLEAHGTSNLTASSAQAAFKTHLATAATFNGEDARAEAFLAEATKAVPDFAPALVVQARMQLVRRQFDSALATAEKALARNDRSASAWHLKGEALQAGKADRDGAEAALRKALEVDPGYAPAHTGLVISRIRAGDIAAGKKQLEAMRAAVPNNAEAIFLGAQIAYLEKDYAKAREGAQLLLRTAPEHPSLLQLAAAVEWQIGSLVIAQKMLETAIRVEPGLEGARVNLANVDILLGQPARALVTLEPLIKAGTRNPSALAAAGEASMQMGRTTDAEALYARAAQVAPGDQRTGTARAIAQLANGDTNLAFASLEALAANSKDGYVDAALAAERLKRSEFDAALAAVDSLIRKVPANASAHELRGRVLASLRRWPEARQSFEKAVELEPRFLAGVISLVKLDLDQNRPEQARVLMDAFLNAEPGNYAAVTALADLRMKAGVPAKDVQASLAEAIKLAPTEPAPRLKLVEILTSQRQVKGALAVAQEAAASLPDDVYVLDALGRALFADGNYQQALVTFRRIISIDPNMAVAHLRVANTHSASGNRSAAVASFRRAIEVDPRLREARLQLVDLLLQDKRSKEALEIAADLQKREPKAAGGYLLEGAVHRKLGNHAGSIAAYRRGLQQASDPAELPLNLFASMLAAKNWKQAESFALEWLSKHPDDGGLIYNLGEGYLMNRDYRAAEVYFGKAVALRPDHVPSLNNLAAMLLTNGKPGATELARRAVQLAPENTAALDTLAGALAVEGQWPEALRTQQRAVTLAPADPALRLNLARIALRAGDKAQAKTELDRLSEMGPRNPFQADVAQLRKEL